MTQRLLFRLPSNIAGPQLRGISFITQVKRTQRDYLVESAGNWRLACSRE